MTPEHFVAALYEGGTTNLIDEDADPAYCPVHGWDTETVLDNGCLIDHADECPAYADKLNDTAV